MKHKLALYLASVIIGVGVLELPIASARSGVIPLVLGLTLMGFITAKIYDRIVEVSKQYGRAQYALHHAALASGLRVSTRIALTLGLALYAFSADVAYVLISTSSIIALSGLINRLYVGLILLLLALFTWRNVYVSKTLMMLAIRSFIIAVSPTRRLAALLYTLSVIIAEAFPDRFVERVEEKSNGMLPRHRLGMIYTLAKILVLVSVTLIGVVLILRISGPKLDTPWIPQDLTNVYYVLGISIFARLGTGVCNALIYDEYLEKHEEINREAVLIVLSAYLFFIFAVIVAVDYATLILEDEKCGHALLALSDELIALGLTSLATLVIALANVFAILTITTAFLGMTDAAAERLEVEGVDYRLSWIAIASLSLITALGVSDMRVTTLLGLAGALGGGLSLFVFPRIVGKPNRKAFIASSTALILYFGYLMYSSTSPQEFYSSLIAIIAFIIAVLTMSLERIKNERTFISEVFKIVTCRKKSWKRRLSMGFRQRSMRMERLRPPNSLIRFRTPSPR